MAGHNFIGRSGTNNFDATRKTVEGSEMEEKELLKIIEEAARDGRIEIDLARKGIKSLPAEIGQLRNLEWLNLSANQLTSVPKELGQLTSLTGLWMGVNQLTSVPKELGQLTNLERLSLYENRLTSVPKELGQLTNIERLYLYNNQLTSVPKELGKLKNLERLWLDENQLTSVPKELGQLKNLQGLSLKGNQLKSVPKELGQLTKLVWLNLDDNPLESPPPEVVKQGTKAILAYLRGLAKGRKKRYETKLMILGDADEGKTCVSRALRGLAFEHQDTTEGVDIEPWELEHPDYPKDKRKKIRLNIWDFEGQEINHQSHQFFLTKRSLYLLVFKGREQFNRNRVEYWLDTISSRAPESEVILVATECESRTPRVPVEELRARYPDLLKHKRCFFEVGCATGKGVKALKKNIQRRASKLEVMGAEWPESYAKAEKGIKERAEKEAHVSRTSLNRLFKKSGIVKIDYENAARLMDYLGILTHFLDCEDLKKFIVLKPQWLTKAISYILENKQLEKDKGEITYSRLDKRWEEKYAGLADTFHRCMREFELCYDLEYRNQRLSLIPLRFGFSKPKKIPWSTIPNAKERRIEYRFDVTPPAGIMSRFIVKTHYMIVKKRKMPKGVYWYNGVFLATGERENRSEALCEFDADKRVMSIWVRAAFPQNMIEQLNGFAQSVFSFFEGLKPERYYGCVKGEDRKESQCAGIHTEKRISYALTQRDTISCEFGYHKINPLYLVTGISSFGEWGALEDRLRVMLRQEMDKEPEWAEKFGKNVRSVLVRINGVADSVEEIKSTTEQLPATIGQQVDLAFRDYLDVLNEMLDNRDFSSAPAIVSIIPADGSKFNPKSWFNKEYILRPYCEYEGGVHNTDFSVTFKKPKKWWEKTAPKLALGVKLLSAGLRIGFAGLPMGVDANLFDEMKSEVGFMKELAGHLKLEGGAESDISAEAGELVQKLKGKKTLRDLRQFGGEDEKRIVRMQLAELFSEIAPRNYKSRKWGTLRRVRMSDNTFRWLCEEHAREYKK
jgi:internalin A